MLTSKQYQIFIGVIFILLFVSFLIVTFFLNQTTIIFTLVFNFLLITLLFFYLVRFKLSIYWPIIIEAIFFITGLSIFWLITSSIWLKFIFLFISFLWAIYLSYNLYNLIRRPRLFQSDGFSKSVVFSTFLISFYFFTSVGALNYFFNVPQFKVIIPLFPILAWLVFYIIWFEGQKKFSPFIYVFALLAIECYFVLTFLPISFYFNAFLSSVFFSISFINFNKLKSLYEQQVGKNYLSN